MEVLTISRILETCNDDLLSFNIRRVKVLKIIKLDAIKIT